MAARLSHSWVLLAWTLVGLGSDQVVGALGLQAKNPWYVHGTPTKKEDQTGLLNTPSRHSHPPHTPPLHLPHNTQNTSSSWT